MLPCSFESDQKRTVDDNDPELDTEPQLDALVVLKSLFRAEMQQSLLVLPISHVGRRWCYLAVVSKSCRGIERRLRRHFLGETHQMQVCAMFRQERIVRNIFYLFFLGAQC